MYIVTRSNNQDDLSIEYVCQECEDAERAIEELRRDDPDGEYSYTFAPLYT